MTPRLLAAARPLGAWALALVCSAGLAASPAMTLELPRLDGTAFVRLDDHAGRPVLLNFWSSDCGPCIVEMPMLFDQALRQPGLQFLGIAVDQRAAATRFLAGRKPTYPQLIASTQPDVLMRRFGNKTGALPFTVVVDARHVVCASRLGAVDADWIAAAARACGTQSSR